MPTCVWHRPEFRRPSTSYVEQSPLCTPWDYRLMIPSGQSLRTMRICQELRYSNCYYVDPTTNTVGPLPRVVWQCDNVTLWFNKFYKPLFKEKMLQLSHQHKDILGYFGATAQFVIFSVRGISAFAKISVRTWLITFIFDRCHCNDTCLTWMWYSIGEQCFDHFEKHRQLTNWGNLFYTHHKHASLLYRLHWKWWKLTTVPSGGQERKWFEARNLLILSAKMRKQR